MKNGAIHLDATGPFAREASVDTRYDPTYDPLVSPGPGQGKQYAPTYWAATAGAAPPDDGPVTQDIDVDVAIIGGGYTGLAAALFLAREHGIKAVVLEANKVSWGCTQPQRRTRAERVGTALALAVDRALGQGCRAQDASRDLRGLRYLQVARRARSIAIRSRAVIS